jgi:hypothetical protein
MCEPGSQCFLQAAKLVPSFAMIVGGALRLSELRGLRMTGRQKAAPCFRGALLGVLASLCFLHAILPTASAVIDSNSIAAAAGTLPKAFSVAEHVLESVAWLVAGFTFVCDQRCGKLPCLRACIWVGVMCLVYSVEVSLAAVAQHQRTDELADVARPPPSFPMSDFSELDLFTACTQFVLTAVLAVLLLSARTCASATPASLEEGAALCTKSCFLPCVAASSSSPRKTNNATFASQNSTRRSGSTSSRDWIDRILFVAPQYQCLLDSSMHCGLEYDDLESSVMVIDGCSNNSTPPPTPPITMPSLSSLFSGLLTKKKDGARDLEWAEAAEKHCPQSAVSVSVVNQVDYSGQALETWPLELEGASAKTVTFLSMYDNSLVYIPPSISLLTNLSELYLCGNRLRFLPAELFMLDKLSVLAVNDNALELIPASIGRLQQLTVLRLHNNRLSCLPQEIQVLYSPLRCGYTFLFFSLSVLVSIYIYIYRYL